MDAADLCVGLLGQPDSRGRPEDYPQSWGVRAYIGPDIFEARSQALPSPPRHL